MAPLGPYEPRPHLAVAVSGGADSLACAVLARDWLATRQGALTAFVVDHGLRPESAAEAHATVARLHTARVPAHILTLSGLARGAGLAARARRARYRVLEDACATRGILHLLLGHHAADQAETVALRQLDHSGPSGLAGMAPLAERRAVRLLRPLLTIPPGRLRAVLRAERLAWVEDPGNRDPGAARNRLRMLRADADGVGPVTHAAVQSAALRAAQRSTSEAGTAANLGRSLRIHPEGFALIPRDPPPPAALATLLRTLAGRAHAPAGATVAAWTAAPRAATLGGVRIMPAGRLAPDAWLLVREPAAMAPDEPCAPGAVWDGRFRVVAAPDIPGITIGALGRSAAKFRHLSTLSSAILQTLPALRRDGRLFAVPHLGYCEDYACDDARMIFDPGVPVASAPFFAPVAGELP